MISCPAGNEGWPISSSFHLAFDPKNSAILDASFSFRDDTPSAAVAKIADYFHANRKIATSPVSFFGTPMKKPDPPSGSTWEDLIFGMRTGFSGNEPAVHKPLLVLLLLARAQKGGPNSVSFREVDGPLKEGIQKFGPSPDSQNPEYPFWHLQKDGLWVVDDADALPRRKGKDRPTRTGLLQNDAKGHVPPELWDQLVKDRELIGRLAGQILARFWPDPSVKTQVLRWAGITLPARTAVRKSVQA